MMPPRQEARPITEEDLHAFVDEVLSPDRHAMVEAHLLQNPDVAARVEGYRMDRQRLKDLGRHIASEPIPARLSLQDMAWKQKRRFSMSAWPYAASILLALGLGLGTGWTLGSRTESDNETGIAAVVHEAASSYKLYAADPQHPVEMGPDRHAELVDWISQRAGVRVHAPNLDKAGYHYLGGRVVVTPNGPGGLFVYGDASGGRIALLVRAMKKADREAPMTQHAENDLISYAWANEGIGFSVVGAQSLTSIQGLAREMRRQMTLMDRS